MLDILEAAVSAEPRPAGDGGQEDEEKEDDDRRPAPRRRRREKEKQQLLVVFSGAGLSASAGMSTFSAPGGLYDRAKRRFKGAAAGDGSRLFHARFFASREADAHAFLGGVAREALAAAPSAAHRALAALAEGGMLARHYTLNVDGLHAAAGMRVWRPEPGEGGAGGEGKGEGDGGLGSTVELHGSARRVVCRACGARADLSAAALRDMRAGRPLACPAAAASSSSSSSSSSCPPGSGRTGVLLYDDPDAGLITPAGPTWRLLARDLARAAAVLWVGISFEQSASVAYFSRVVRGLRAQAAAEEAEEEAAEGPPPARPRPRPPPRLPPQVVVNPASEDAVFNLQSGAAPGDLRGDVRVLEVRAEADAALPALAARLLGAPGGGGGGGAAAAAGASGGGGGGGAKSGD